MDNWQTESSKVVYETPWIRVLKDKIINQTGNVPAYLLLAKNVQSAGRATDEAEDIASQQFKSLKEIESMIVRGILVGSPVIAALYMAKMHGL